MEEDPNFGREGSFYQIPNDTYEIIQKIIDGNLPFDLNQQHIKLLTSMEVGLETKDLEKLDEITNDAKEKKSLTATTQILSNTK